MKKILLLFIISSCFFTSCLSTNSTFGTEKQSQGNLVISYDEFQERTTVNVKNSNITNFSGRGLQSFAIYPYFIYNDTDLTCRLTLEMQGSTSKFNKIIFITEKGKYQITFSENKQGTGEKIPNNEFTAYAKGDYIINKNQFEFLGEIINSSSLKAAVYTTNNTVLEITEYGNRTKQMYNEFYNYYVSEGLSNLTDSESEILIIKK